MSELKVGDRIKDNDPRMYSGRVLTITAILGDLVAARDSTGRKFRYQRRRIYIDSKPRRSGFSRIEP